jgi:hypothetical protein
MERKDNLEFYKKNPFIQTYTGKKFHFLDPNQDEICIEDIAHALSNLCRFGGHTKRFYSVGEHSIYVSRNVPVEDALEGLLHDATEAYLVDIPKPIKGFLGNYEEMEQKIYLAIAEKFGLAKELPQSVKDADARMLFTEKQILSPVDWGWELEPYDIELACESPELIKSLFLLKYYQLQNARNGK